ncbi:gluconolaconase [Marilutibacter chinensis]|uniref:Gluconolaconase n=1 Tax=Marilutibacter chinensis TaxID=2912247 RepID=A0ABS9HSK4_9GAMM|nr:gluconolaconase [Lysobacter chinensis]MCF7221909.1 gluconolaconase [Lysobacter chinensis]
MTHDSRMRGALIWLVAGLTAAALAATFVMGRPPALPPFEEAGPPRTLLDWSGRVSLLAGDGVRGADDGPGARARFADPWGLALWEAPVRTGTDPGQAADMAAHTARLYMTDAGDNNRIRMVDGEGRVATVAGGGEGFADGPAATARFDTPSGLALDLAGNLYIADTGNHAIRKLTPAGQVSTLAGTGSPGFRDGPGAQAQFNGPIGVAVDASGRVYVADTYNDRIRIIQPDGTVGTLAGDGRPGDFDGPGPQARFDTPTGLAVSARGEVWVADAGNGHIRHVSSRGDVTTLLRDAPTTPIGLTRTHDGVLYAAGVRPAIVLQIAGDGRWHAITREMPGRFSRPAGVAVDAHGALYLSDAGAYRVHRIASAAAPVHEAATAAPVAMIATAHARPEGAEHDADALGPSALNPLPDTGGRWPLHPQLGWHEVVGTLGEVRGDYDGESRHHLHGGLDIRGDVGQPVVAIADAKVSSPFAAWGMGRLGEGLAVDTIQYIHMRVGRLPNGEGIDPARFAMILDDEGEPQRIRVRRGTRFAVGDVLGTINRMAHVHLAVGASGYEVNAATLGFANYADSQPPRIDGIALVDVSDRPLPVRDGRVQVAADARDLRIVVDAWDQVDRNLPRRRLGLYALGYQWLDASGRPLPGHESPRISIEFDRMPIEPHAVKVAYAPGSGITVHGSAVTRFRYELTNTLRGGRLATGYWQPSELVPGDYLLRITARDFSGNEAVAGRDLRVTITRPSPATSAMDG